MINIEMEEHEFFKQTVQHLARCLSSLNPTPWEKVSKITTPNCFPSMISAAIIKINLTCLNIQLFLAVLLTYILIQWQYLLVTLRHINQLYAKSMPHVDKTTR